MHSSHIDPERVAEEKQKLLSFLDCGRVQDVHTKPSGRGRHRGSESSIIHLNSVEQSELAHHVH